MEGIIINWTEDKKSGTITIPKEFYERETVFCVADKFSHNFYVSVMPKNDKHVCLTLMPKNGELIDDLVFKEISNALITIQTVRDLQKEFGSLRDKIVAQAFSSVGK